MGLIDKLIGYFTGENEKELIVDNNVSSDPLVEFARQRYNSFVIKWKERGFNTFEEVECFGIIYSTKGYCYHN